MAFDIDRFHKSTSRVRKFLKKNSKRPGPNAIHKLRTSTRSLEATFETLGVHSQDHVKRLLDGLAEVRKRAGKVRDMDVLTANALTVKPAGEQECLVQLLEYLGGKRNKCAKKLNNVIGKSKSRVLPDLKRTSKRVEEILKAAKDNPGDSDAMRVTMARTIQLCTELKRPVRLTKNNLHPYRLKVKELLNVLQLSDHADDMDFREKLSEVKDAIGEWHDWEELIAIARASLDHGPSCKLIKHMSDTSSSKFEHALLLTRRLRRDYLETRSKKSSAPNSKSELLSEPVLTAVAEFARN